MEEDKPRGGRRRERPPLRFRSDSYWRPPRDFGREAAGTRRENAFEGSKSTNLVWDLGSFLSLFLTALLLLFLAAGCSSGAEEARQVTPLPPDTTTDNGSTTEDDAQSESIEGETFTLAQSFPVPPRFEAAYQREVPIVVEFFQRGKDPYYPQGLEVDEMVNNDLTDLRDDYPQVEFFTYDNGTPATPSPAKTSSRRSTGPLPPS